MSESKITMTIGELQSILDDQKRQTAQYITRNLSCYHWWNTGIDNKRAKEELANEANKSPYADDFKVLSKYLK